MKTAALPILLASLFWLPTAQAEIYKCTQAGGKTVFSDQPCEAGQSSSTVKPTAAAPRTTGESTKTASAATIAECVKWRDQIRDMVENGTSKSGPEMVAFIKKADAQCKGLTLPEASTAENTQAKNRQAQKNAECATQAKLLDERRPRLASMGEQDKKAFAAVENNYANTCK